MTKKVTVIYKDGEVEVYHCRKTERSKGFLIIYTDSGVGDGRVSISESLIRKVIEE